MKPAPAKGPLSLALAALLCAAGASAAEPEAPAAAPRGPGRQLLSLGVGLLDPLSRVSFAGVQGGGTGQNGDTSVGFGAQWDYYLTADLAAGAELDYLDRAATLSPRLFPAAISRVSGDSWLMLGLLRWSLPKLRRARPFVLAGAGGARNTLSVDVRASNWADTNTQETRRLVDDAQWTPAYSARVGLDFDDLASLPGVVTLEAGWTGLAGARYAATPQGRAQGVGDVAAPLNLLLLSARYGWRF